MFLLYKAIQAEHRTVHNKKTNLVPTILLHRILVLVIYDSMFSLIIAGLHKDRIVFKLRICSFSVPLIYVYSRVPVSTDSVNSVSVIRGSTRPEKKIGKLKKYTVHKFQNARQTRTDSNIVKSSSPNAPST
jgi:hypothetical protein